MNLKTILILAFFAMGLFIFIIPVLLRWNIIIFSMPLTIWGLAIMLIAGGLNFFLEAMGR